MRTIVYIIISIVLFSCNTGVNKKTSDKSSGNNAKSYLTEGEHEIEIDGVKLWYMVRGKGPILIAYPSSAGWGGDCSVYVEYLKPWEENRTVIYMEPRGLGRSERLNSMSEYSMNKYAQELENFREKLGINKFDLTGHCYAGIISMKYALKYQQYLNHLILISTFPKSEYPGYYEWLKNRAGYDNMVNRNTEIKKEGLEGKEKLKEEMKNWYTVTFHDYNKHKETFETIMDNTIFSTLPEKQFRTVDEANYNILDSINQIKTKTIILYGDEDFPPVIFGSKDIKNKIPNSKIVEIENSSHWTFIERPDVFFAETIDFLKN
ncbi:MAG: alpha/beta hydrolase [Prolixibacteraceae bacterium]|jgi:proline iminopeptidase